MALSLSEYRDLIVGGSYIPIRQSPQKLSHGQEVARWLNQNQVNFQLFITQTPPAYRTRLLTQRHLTASAIGRIQVAIGSQHQLGWLAGFETFPESQDECHSHILIACDTVELDPYFIRKLLSFDGHTDVRQIKPGTSPVSYVLKQCQNPNCCWDFSENLLGMGLKPCSLDDFKQRFGLPIQQPIIKIR